MVRKDIHRYACMLRLLQYGLLHEAQSIDSIGQDLFGVAADVPVVEGSDDSEQEGEGSQDAVMKARDTYVRKLLQDHRINMGDIRKGKHEGASELRTQLVKAFLADVLKARACASCSGISPTYRKDRFVNIFEKPLSPKESAKMAQNNLRMKDAILLLNRQKEKHDKYADDEGIADLNLSSGESDHGDDDEGVGEGLDVNGDTAMTDVSSKQKKVGKGKDGSQRLVHVMEVKGRLDLLFQKEHDILTLLYNSKPVRNRSQKISADMFFLQTILVPPNRYRPEARMGNSQITEAQQNTLYKKILRSSSNLAQISKDLAASAESAETGDKTAKAGRARDMTSLQKAWNDLQEQVNALIDMSKGPNSVAASQRLEDGIKQRLEKKEGLFRKNMMGKRVNYAARSVISPDPNIETNEIGVPPVFAKKLTYPEPVTSHNFKDMQQAVINGTDKWPGASAIENENGQIVNLRTKSAEDRLSLANQLLAPSGNNFSGTRNKKVYRHITNGDVVLMNRQPTLHKPSIMGHRVRVLPGEKTIRMHYANTHTYNADFDGDEMNMHFPQNEVARAEALQLADTDHQYISGTQGKPLRGLIQDHISVSVDLCSKDSFFSRGAYQQLIYSALRPESGHITSERIELVPPAVIKPVARWTGKQVITTILKNIKPNDCGDLWMNSKTQVKGERWGVHVEEGQVLFRDGEFVCGILDKSQLGVSAGGLIHAIHEIYGPAVAGKLLSSMGRLLTRYEAERAFTCGMDDLRLTPEGEAARKEKLEAARSVGLKVAAQYVTLSEQNPDESDPELLKRLEEVARDDKKQESLDLLVNQACADVSKEITSTCLPAGLEKQFPKNHMQSMTTSGAKGGPVNANLISCNLGQQVLEGRRVPLMVSGKSLPSFKPFDTDVRAGGYIVNRFLTGIRPQEYYFHHMAGREGLIDTAVKTSRSGYLQRCLIKGMEGLKVSYDTSVRDSDGSLVQFLYGEDGLDITKQTYLNDYRFLLNNMDSQLAQIRYTDQSTRIMFEHKDRIIKQMKTAIKGANGFRGTATDPVTSYLDPARYAFATSEKFFKAMTEYTKANPDGLIREKAPKETRTSQPGQAAGIGRKTAEKILAAKYVRSLVEPGEAVGIVAGQSVGEPSTQMTLNTFHLAGHSAKNVTLGIPRLREILMTASTKISTPSMTLVLNEELRREEGEKFAKAISKLPLSHVLDRATVRERVGRGIAYSVAKIFEVRLRFFPSTEYTKTYAIEKSDVLQTVERKFIPTLESLVIREMKKRRSGDNGSAAPQVGVSSGTVEMAAASGDAGGGGRGDDEDDDDEGDEDATSAKQRAQRTEAVSYGPNDDDDDAIQLQMQRDTSPVGAEMEDEAYGGSPEPGERETDGEGEDGGRTDDHDTGEALSKSREARIKAKHEHISQFRCDEIHGEWCEFTLEFDASLPKLLMLNLVQDAVKKSLVQQITGVGVCTFDEKAEIINPKTGEKTKVPAVHTEGTNLRAMQQYGDYINPNMISTNDIAAVLEMYGVEACRNNIVRELREVFGSHGISVDSRHLNLIGDYMTRNGGFTPFNRMGLTGNVSPFTKMSFETTLAFLKDAILDGDWDDLSTPSGRLVMGRLGKVGTGAFDVFTNVPTEHFDPVRARMELDVA
jgi:DNA-directed RNA polymerase I subunit RPA1